MKKLSTFIIVLSCTFLSAQNINDVLRYSLEETQGTARFQAIGGAFGALGGDLSALNVNPAGSAVFNFSEFSLTGSNYNRDNEVLFGNSFTDNNINSVKLNQVGGVFVFKSSDSPWKKLALAFNYDQVRNFDNEFVASGTTTQGVDNYFLNFAQGVELGPLRVQEGEFIEDAYLDIGASLGFGAQQAFLGFQSGLIEPTADEDTNTSYVSNAQYSAVNQEYLQSTSGFNSKFTANFAGQYQENLYVGASLNFHSVLFEQLTLLDENGYDPTSPVQFTTFDNFLRTEGYGFSFSVGAIAKLNDNIRIGGSYQSPTWYRLTDDTSQRINSTLAEPDIDFIDFGIVNLFEEYNIKTPGKITGSAAVVFGKDGFLSFDYGYQDFSQAELTPNADPNFAAENDFIANTLGIVNSYRIGGEFRIDNVSLRGGYRFEESPYENGEIIGDLVGYSGGIGLNFGPSRLDVAFTRTERDINELLFSSGLDSSVDINQINTNITLGYSFKF
ncbi:MAG: aromatic hydrocarbon degradation protein [Bacteroidota bacterium]